MRILRMLGVCAAAVALAGCTVPAAVSASATLAADTAPKYVQVSKSSAPDPDLEVFGGRYFVYATSGADGVLPIFESKTASVRGGFTKTGNIFAKAPAGYSGLWAPHVVHVGAFYLAFFTASYKGGNHAVYWVYSTHPDKGFSKTPVKVADGGGSAWEAIDPTVYHGAKGLYLVWRRGEFTPRFPRGTFQIRARLFSVSIAHGAPKVTLAAGKSRVLAQVTGNAPVMEAPSLLFYNHKLWLFVARGAYTDCCGLPYHTDVWVAGGIGGTFRQVGTVMKNGQGWGTGPGSASVISANGIVYIAYHVWSGNTRVTRIAQLVWKNGKPSATVLPAGASA